MLRFWFSDLELLSDEDGEECVKFVVNNASTRIIGVGKMDEVERWDKMDKKYIKVERPEIINSYNKNMGGVDKLDQLVSYYRIMINSRKWTLRMLFHVVDLAIVNSWLEYSQDAKTAGIPQAQVTFSNAFDTFSSDSQQASCAQ
ncbi:hypothetical protein PR048_026568 [Dryococelus australis]|uniref:PiggyBac transposable element-derived protein domain-containing protein n=1 Tax=Dryococelus australis TaxID=614101 RepID=A0ABQ9GLR8_9NEOP|nr:hypothetical protein PR048_026568 [Dryococelus australis]